MRQCPSCDATARDEARFCPGCGAGLADATVPEATLPTTKAQGALPPIKPGPPPVVIPPSPDARLEGPGVDAAPAPAPGRSSAGMIVAVIAVALVVVGSAVAAALVLTGNGGSDNASTSLETGGTVDGTGGSATNPEPSTTTAPPTTTTTTEPPVPEAQQVAQRLATAFADGDWPAARALEPAKSGFSDGQFQQSYGDLVASTVIPAGTIAAGTGPQTLRLGLVAHQNRGGAVLTTVYCVQWDVNPGAQTVRQDSSSFTLGEIPGQHVDPESQRSAIEASC